MFFDEALGLLFEGRPANKGRKVEAVLTGIGFPDRISKS